MIPVTKSFLPPVEEYIEYIRLIYGTGILTNRGELVKNLELKLMDHLEIERILILNNGTLPIQIAIKLLGQKGEIITTPFSYIATTSSIIWEGCKPVFVDIHPEYFTIDEAKIEQAVTSKTTAILATHVFGNPCNVEAIEKIAQKYDLKVIYDAAHSFGVKYNGKSIFEYGDVSTCSFHATKLFHTGEGGAIFCKDEDLFHKVYYSHNFGHNGPIDFHGLGINAKISELQAAMGLAVLPYIEDILGSRKSIVEFYDSNLDRGKVRNMKLRTGTSWNYSYYPVIFESETILLTLQEALSKEGIFPRRYFYPSLNTIPFIKGVKMPVSEDIASRILCLPLYHNLDIKNLERIVTIINKIVC